MIKTILEGRREEILGKDPNKFRVPSVEEVDTNFHKNTKYKYLGWVFDQYNKNPDYSFEELSNFAERFDKLSKNLEKKDLYLYKDLSELLDIFKFYGSTKEEKKSGKKVIFEDNDFLVVRPLTQDASCYYGANTKWCTSSTKEGKNKFDQYSSTGKLYYIISKKPLDMTNWSKIAVYVDDYYGGEVLYDNLDVTLNEKQKQDYYSLLPSSLLTNLRDDYSGESSSNKWRNIKNVLYTYPYFKFKMRNKVVEIYGEDNKFQFTIDGEEFYVVVEDNKLIFYSLEKPIHDEVNIEEFLKTDGGINLNISFRNLVYLSFVKYMVYFMEKYIES